MHRLAWVSFFLIIAVLAGFFAWLSRPGVAGAVLVNFAAVFLAIGLFEAFLAWQEAKGDGTRLEGSVTGEFSRPDDLLGYVPKENQSATARKWYHDSLVYDVVYTIGSNGLRIAPPTRPGASSGCLLFFGDSITFGEGVNDHESFPYQVGIKTSGEYAIHNFAFSGYGPHQMLANLQSGRVASVAHCTPSQLIYLVIPEHTERVAGLAVWDKHGPRFKLDTDGAVHREGNFDDPVRLFGPWTEPRWLQEKFDRFLTWQKFFGRGRKGGPRELALLIAIIRQSARTAKARYPGSKFDVVLWDGSDNERVRAIEAELTASDIPVHRITAAIPDFRANWRQYVLSEHDLHPNPRQHEKLAEYVALHILKDEKAPSGLPAQ